MYLPLDHLSFYELQSTPLVLLAAHNSSKIYFSTDVGQTWTFRSTLPDTHQPGVSRFIGAKDTILNRCFYLCIDTGAAAAVYSTDGGLNWTTGGSLPISASIIPTYTDFALGSNGTYLSAAIHAAISPIQVVFVVRSIDGGTSWANVNPTTVSTSGAERNPDLASGNGLWVLVWCTVSVPALFGDGDIIAVHPVDDGQTWSNYSVVNSDVTYDTDADDFPSIVFTAVPLTWLVTFSGSTNSSGSDTDIFRTYSNDSISWSLSQAVNTYALTDSNATGIDRNVKSVYTNGEWITGWEITNNTLGSSNTRLAYSTDFVIWNQLQGPSATATCYFFDEMVTITDSAVLLMLSPNYFPFSIACTFSRLSC